uniref:Bestrophin homolog n=1 Tax=Strigamia maritima TaxID=126957 RepID=T1JF92_STRMM
MTFSYSKRCSTVKNIGNFWQLLFIWKASVYKMLWVDLSIFLFLYYAMGLSYNFLLEGKAKEIFEEICYYCEAQMSLIDPLSFVLGFYVSNIIDRWITQLRTLPVVDYIATDVSVGIKGMDAQTRLMRRTIMRYINVSFIMAMMVICTPVQRRFPSFDHLVVAGLRIHEGNTCMLFDSEKKALEIIHEKMPIYNVYWVPLIWAVNIATKAQQQNIITNHNQGEEIKERIDEFHAKCELLLTYDWISVPLIYTQVVSLAVYTFFLAAIFGRQVLDQESSEHHVHQPIDIYFPIFTILQFIFYMGWLKVAKIMINPFGDDDDDFEINWLIDKNIQVGFAIVDEVHLYIPKMVKDKFWDEVIPKFLPYEKEKDMKLEQAPIVLNPKIPLFKNDKFRWVKRKKAILESSIRQKECMNIEQPSDIGTSVVLPETINQHDIFLQQQMQYSKKRWNLLAIIIHVHWRASVYKLLWVDLSIFLFLYYTMGLSYNFLLEGRSKVIFEEICYYCAAEMHFIPLSFVLGFYVSNIIDRWIAQVRALPVVDYIATDVSVSIKGMDTETRIMRRTIMRYINVSFIMAMMVICTPVQKRFPSFDHLVVAGRMLFNSEKKALESIHDKMPLHNVYWVPLIWAVNIICKARQQNIITNDSEAANIIKKIGAFQANCKLLLTYDYVSIPLIYTQVVSLAVYTFFLAAILGRQVLDQDEEHRVLQPIDIYFPMFTILQFVFYMGWLKVAEILINPFGDDDDDFEINWLIDKNIQMGYAIVDEVHLRIPKMVKDQFWKEVIPKILPYGEEKDMNLEHAPRVLDPKKPLFHIEKFSWRGDDGKKNENQFWNQVLGRGMHGRTRSTR